MKKRHFGQAIALLLAFSLMIPSVAFEPKKNEDIRVSEPKSSAANLPERGESGGAGDNSGGGTHDLPNEGNSNASGDTIGTDEDNAGSEVGPDEDRTKEPTDIEKEEDASEETLEEEPIEIEPIEIKPVLKGAAYDSLEAVPKIGLAGPNLVWELRENGKNNYTLVIRKALSDDEINELGDAEAQAMGESSYRRPAGNDATGAGAIYHYKNPSDKNVIREEAPWRITYKNGKNTVRLYSYIKKIELLEGTDDTDITAIGDNAFSGLTGVTEVTIPSGISKIGENAFFGLTGISSINIPRSVTSIGENAFGGCTALSKVMTEIPTGGFDMPKMSASAEGDEDAFAPIFTGIKKVNIVGHPVKSSWKEYAKCFSNVTFSPYKLTIKFDPNVGEGSDAEKAGTVTGGKKSIVVDCDEEGPNYEKAIGSTETLYRQYFTFKEWNIDEKPVDLDPYKDKKCFSSNKVINYTMFPSVLEEGELTQDKDVTLYAQWTPIQETYYIVLNGNGATNTKSTIIKYQLDLSDPNNPQIPNLSLPDLSATYKKKGYDLTGWEVQPKHVGVKTVVYKFEDYREGSDNPDAQKATTLPLSAVLTTNEGEAIDEYDTEYDPDSVADKNDLRKTKVSDQVLTLHAHWEAHPYSINYYSGNDRIVFGDQKSDSATDTYTIKDTFKIDLAKRTPTKPGYTFVGWYTNKNFTKKATTIKKGTTDNKDYYAKWTPLKYEINFDPGEADESVTFDTKTKAKMPALTKRVYSTKYTLPANAFKMIANDSTTITAKTQFAGWIIKRPGGATDSEDPIYDKIYDNKASVRASTEKWAEKPNLIEAGITLVAQWRTPHRSIALKNVKKSDFAHVPEIAGTGKHYPTEYVQGTGATIPAPKRVGYTFKGWYKDASLASKYKVSNDDGEVVIGETETKSQTYYAKWAKNTFSIAFMNGVSGENATAGMRTITKCSRSTSYILYANKFKPSESENDDGKTQFAGWRMAYIAQKGTDLTDPAIDYTKDASDTNVPAALREIFYPASKPFRASDQILDAGAGEKFDPAPDSTIVFVPIWREPEYTISYKNVAGSDYQGVPEGVDALPTSYVLGKELSIRSVNKVGYDFDGWYLDKKFKYPAVELENDDDKPLEITITPEDKGGNKTYYAKFTPHTYTVVFDNGQDMGREFDDGWTPPNINGKVKSIKVKYGSKFTLPANGYKRTGYGFAGWRAEGMYDAEGQPIENDPVYNPNIPVDPTSPSLATTPRFKNKQKNISNLCPTEGGKVTLVACWKPVPYTITYKDIAVGISGTKADMTIKYTIEDKDILHPLTPRRAGYTFDKWYTSASYKKTSVSDRVPAHSTGNKTYYARWSGNPYKLVFDYNLDGIQARFSADALVDTEKQIDTPPISSNAIASTYGKSVKLPANKYVLPAFTFSGWSENPIADTVSWKDKATLSKLQFPPENSGNIEEPTVVTLYAVWTPTPYKIIYNNMDGKGTKGNTNPTTYTIVDTLKTAEGFPIKDTGIKRTGYAFNGWYNTEDAAGVKIDIDVVDAADYVKPIVYIPRQTYNQKFNVWAGWSGYHYTVKFDGNKGATVIKGKEAPADISTTYGEAFPLPENTFEKTYYKFDGWSLNEGKGSRYKGKEVSNLPVEKNDDVVTLTACWYNPTFNLDYDRSLKVDDKTLEKLFPTGNFNYLAVGNSITLSVPTPGLWWDYSGMAASSPSKDWVHLTADGLRGRKKSSLKPINFVVWERSQQRNQTRVLIEDYLCPQLDLVTFQLGENAINYTSTLYTDYYNLFKYALDKTIDPDTGEGKTQIIVVGQYWERPIPESTKKSAVVELRKKYGNRIKFVEIGNLDPAGRSSIGAVVSGADGQMHTISDYTVGAHPGDHGMRGIADQVMNAFRR